MEPIVIVWVKPMSTQHGNQCLAVGIKNQPSISLL